MGSVKFNIFSNVPFTFSKHDELIDPKKFVSYCAYLLLERVNIHLKFCNHLAAKNVAAINTHEIFI